MWRGTLAGNERVRQLGRHEMKEARAIRRGHRRKAAEAAGGNSGPFSLFRWGSNRRNGQAAPAPAAMPQRHVSSGSKHHRHGSQSHHAQRPTPAQRKSSTGSKSAHHHSSKQGRTSSRPEPTRQRSTHSSKGKPRGPSRQSSGRR